MVGVGIVITLAVAVDKVGWSLLDDFLTVSQGTHGHNGRHDAQYFHDWFKSSSPDM